MANRYTRRLKKKKDNKKEFSLNDVQRSIAIAIEMKKISKGHLFSKNLKDRCVFCGANMKTKKECSYWAMTLIDRIQSVLVNPDFYTDENIQALWLQHGEEYQNIKLPLVFGAEKKDDKEN